LRAMRKSSEVSWHVLNLIGIDDSLSTYNYTRYYTCIYHISVFGFLYTNSNSKISLIINLRIFDLVLSLLTTLLK
jgi:hypothetical protein